MKKLSFFLMAMLFSVMSFAQTVLFTQTYPGSPSTYTNAYTKSFNLTTNDYTLTYTNINNGTKKEGWTAIRSGSKSGASVATILSEQIAKPIAKVAVNFTQVTASSTNALYLEVAATADFASATKIEADIAKGTVEFTITAPVANQYYRVTIDQAKGSANGFNRWDKVIFYEGEAASGDVEVVAAPEFSVANANFSAAFTLNITSEEGTTLKYTLDNTDPATSATAVEVAANTASVEITKSTAVKAIAIKGDLVSVVKSKVYCYVNTKETAYTVAEAMKVIDAGLGLDNELYIKGTVSKVESYNATYGSITYWIEDEEGNDFECYSGLGLDKAKFTAKEDIEIGAYVVACGVMKKYNTTYEFDYNNYLVEYNAPVIEEPTIECKDALDFGAVAYNAEVAAQTLEVAGYNLTSDITVTLSEGAAFTVDQTTLSAEGGNLVVTPVSPLTVGTHTATLTLASGEATAEVTLTIVAKDVYTITWSVNGETTTTSVVEGDKLVLPAAPEAPEACSEKVFVGWTAAEEVNADGSEIEWVTAATAPTAAATYYAVFAVQEGEGGLSEVVDVLNRALTGVEGTNYASWADVSATSDAVYAGQSAGDKESIQLRSNNSNSGVISTTSGGKLAKVVVTWQGETWTGRTLNVYGSNTAYASPTNLYGDASGEKLGTIVCGTSTELVIEGDYAYVGLRSNRGAMYLDEIQITWTTGAAATYTDYSTTCEAEPEYEEISLSVTDLEIKMDEQVILKGTAMMQSPKDITISLVVDASEANEDGTFNLTDESEITFMETPMTFISGVAMIDLESNMARAIVRVEFEGMYFEFTFDMTALVPAIDVVVDDATITVEKLDDGMGGTYENITVSAKWNESVLVIEGVEKAHEGFIQIKETFEVDGEEDWYIWMCMNGVITTVDNVLTVKGEFKNNFTGDVYNVTISGTLPSGATALENLDTTVAPAKAIVNGQLVIIKNGVQYNATGAVVK